MPLTLSPNCQTRVFSEKQLQDATAAVSMLNLGSSSMGKSAAASVLAGQAIAVSAVAPSPAAAGGGGGGGGSGAGDRSSTPEPEAAPPAPALPEGWFTRVSKSTGKTYYQHKATGKTTWELPTADS